MNECSSGCALPGRRQFLKDATLALGAVMAALAATPREATAMPLSLGAGLGVADDEATYPLPTAEGVTIDRDEEVILVRWKGELFAFALSCPHQNTSLKWLDDGARFQCPKHKSRYQPDGTFISGRATRNMDRFALRTQGSKVIVTLSKLYESDKQVALWEQAHLAL